MRCPPARGITEHYRGKCATCMQCEALRPKDPLSGLLPEELPQCLMIRLAPGIGVQLAASAGALALALVNQSEAANAIAIFAAGSQDNQYLMLSRLGLKTVSGVEPVISTEYDDVIRVMYCTRTQELQPRFQRMMDAMASTVGIDQMLRV